MLLAQKKSQQGSAEKQDAAYWAGNKKEQVKQGTNIVNRGSNIIRAKEKLKATESCEDMEGCEYVELSADEVEAVLGEVEPSVKMLLQTALDRFYAEQHERNEDLFSDLVHEQIAELGIDDDQQVDQIDQAAEMLFNALFPETEAGDADDGDINMDDDDVDMDDVGNKLDDGELDDDMTNIDFGHKADTEFMELSKHNRSLLALAADVYQEPFNAMQQEALLNLLDDIEADVVALDNFEESAESIRGECCVSAEELERFDAFLDKIKETMQAQADDVEQSVTD